jgi:hypothetical protein
VWPTIVVMPRVVGPDPGGVVLVVDQHVVGALGADHAHGPLGVTGPAWRALEAGWGVPGAAAGGVAVVVPVRYRLAVALRVVRRDQAERLLAGAVGKTGECTAATHSPVPARCWPECPRFRVQHQDRTRVDDTSRSHANWHVRFPLPARGSEVGSGSPTTTWPSQSWPGLVFRGGWCRNFHGMCMLAPVCRGRQQRYFKPTRDFKNH